MTMTKSELRKARREAVAAGVPLTGELAIPGQKTTTATKPAPKTATAPPKRGGRKASRAEQYGRYLDCGPSAWDNRD